MIDFIKWKKSGYPLVLMNSETILKSVRILEKGFSWILLCLAWNFPLFLFRVTHESSVNKLIAAKAGNFNFVSQDIKMSSAIELTLFLKEHESIFTILFVLINALFFLQAGNIGKKFCYVGYVLILILNLYCVYFMQFHLLNKLLG